MVPGLGVLGSPWGWVRCPDDLCFLGRLAQEDRLTTGAAGVVVVLCFVFLTTCLLELDELACYLGFDQLGTFFKVRPPLFCRFFFGFSGLVALLLLLLGGWGSPCRVFPCVFPLVLGRVGGVFLFFFLLCTLASCVFSVGIG